MVVYVCFLGDFFLKSSWETVFILKYTDQIGIIVHTSVKMSEVRALFLRHECKVGKV